MSQAIGAKRRVFAGILFLLLSTFDSAACSSNHAESTPSPSTTSVTLSADVATPASIKQAMLKPKPSASGGVVLFQTLSFSTSDGVVKLLDIVVDLTKANVRVVDVVEGLPKTTQAYRSYSLQEVISALRPIAAVSGASGKGLSLPVPLGLVVDDGRVTSKIDNTSEFATGLFCVRADGTARILFRNSYKEGDCKQAIQSGPVVVGPGGAPGINERETQRAPHEYLLVAMSGDGRLHIISTSSTHLFYLDKYLRTALHIYSALNIGTGRLHSAMYYVGSGAPVTFGNLDGAIPSAITVFAKL